MPLTFEQLPRETNKAFAAFKAYLDFGPERSLVTVGDKIGKHRTQMERWSKKYDWTGRVQAYGAHIAETERLAIERLAVERAVEWHKLHEGVRREAWKEAEETIAIVRKAREEWVAKGRVPGWEGMARMLELAFKLKQFAAGMPSEIKEVNTNINATIDVDWEIAIRKAYQVAAPPATVEAAPISPVEPAGKIETIVDVAEVKP
jgi:hypothetical protein